MLVDSLVSGQTVTVDLSENYWGGNTPVPEETVPETEAPVPAAITPVAMRPAAEDEPVTAEDVMLEDEELPLAEEKESIGYGSA